MKFFRKLLFILLCSLLLICCGIFVSMGWYFSDKLLNPQKSPESPELSTYWQKANEYGLILSPFSVKTSDGLNINACMIQANKESTLAVRQKRIAHALAQRNQMPPAPAKGLRGTILLLHEEGTSLEHMFVFAEYLTGAGFQCIAYDARAHGKSEGEICTWGHKEKFDLSKVLKEAQTKFAPLGPIGVLGFSMGGSIALQGLPENPNIRSIVAIAPFATLRDAAWRMGENYTTKPWLYATFFSMDLVTSWREGFRTMDIAPVAVAANTTIPALLIAAENDKITPPNDSERILEALKSKEKKLIIIPNATHDEILTKGSDEMMISICEFFGQNNHLPTPNLNIGTQRKIESPETKTP